MYSISTASLLLLLGIIGGLIVIICLIAVLYFVIQSNSSNIQNKKHAKTKLKVKNNKIYG